MQNGRLPSFAFIWRSEKDAHLLENMHMLERARREFGPFWHLLLWIFEMKTHAVYLPSNASNLGWNHRSRREGTVVEG